jgi:hypothetical protein
MDKIKTKQDWIPKYPGIISLFLNCIYELHVSEQAFTNFKEITAKYFWKAMAITHRHLTVEAWVQLQGSSFAIYGGQNSTEHWS